MNEDIRLFEQECRESIKKYPSFKAGDTIEVICEYNEGAKKTTQVFKGIVIQRRHPRTNGETFTVRKISDGIAVEKIFSILSPMIKDIKLINHGKVRRARIFYVREKQGKDSKIQTLFKNATPIANITPAENNAVAGQQDK
jgi:large subunit ribosomal protein L19